MRALSKSIGEDEKGLVDEPPSPIPDEEGAA
jgi:hypothetical protein